MTQNPLFTAIMDGMDRARGFEPVNSEERIDAQNLKVIRTSRFSGVKRERILPITESQWAAWQAGGYIQTCLRNLSEEDREYILTGTTQAEWDEAFKDNDE